MMKEDLEEMLRNMKKALERINSDLEEAIKAVADCSARNVTRDGTDSDTDKNSDDLDLYEVFGGD